MTQEWSRWGLNERIGCCLYKRQHLILSFQGHSPVILSHSDNLVQSFCLNFWMMTGWRNDGKMTDISEFIFFLSLRKPPHSSSFRHSISFVNEREWKFQWEYCILRSFWSFSLHFVIFRHPRMMKNDRMRGNEGSFSNKGETLNSENPSNSATFRHSIILLPSSWDHSIHLRVISSFQSHSSSWSMKNHPMPTLYSFCGVRTKESGAVSYRDSTWFFRSDPAKAV